MVRKTENEKNPLKTFPKVRTIYEKNVGIDVKTDIRNEAS